MNVSEIKQKLKQNIAEDAITPLLSGALGAVLLPLVLGKSKFKLNSSISLPVWVLGGFLSSSTMGLSELVNKQLLPHIVKNKRLKNIESTGITIGSSALFFYLAPKLLTSRNITNQQSISLLLSGAMSAVGGQLLYDNLFAKIDVDVKEIEEFEE